MVKRSQTSKNTAVRAHNRREQIVEAAARLFAQHGFDATKMRDIADATGILVGSIYYHFESKEELFFAGYSAGMEYVIAAVDRAIEGETRPLEKLEKAIIAHCEALNAERALLNIMLPTVPETLGEYRDKINRMRDEYESRFKAILEDLEIIEPLDPRLFLINLLGTMNYTRFWFRPGRRSAEDVGREIFKVYSLGLRPKS
jgi:AcrR family transcriptional regulator